MTLVNHQRILMLTPK